MIQTTGRVRARLGIYEYLARIIVKPEILLRTKEVGISINFAGNSTKITPRGSLHSKEYKS